MCPVVLVLIVETEMELERIGDITVGRRPFNNAAYAFWESFDLLDSYTRIRQLAEILTAAVSPSLGWFYSI